MIDQKWYKHFKSKNVLLRLDLNVPISGSKILDDSRILNSIETVRNLYEAGAKIIVISHLGKPNGKKVSSLSLKPVVESFSQNSNLPCFLHLGNIDRKSIKKQLKHSVVFLENVRFDPGEQNCSEDFIKKISSIGDCFVNDAFSVCHRAHGSVFGIAQHLPSFAGPSILHETQNLHALTHNPKNPFWVVMGGAKLKTKIPNLNQIKKIDIYTSHHTHYVIGTGANDPQKMDPNASRETLDHSIMYIFAVALEDGTWHHIRSYTKARAKRKSTIKIWRSIKTHEDKKWTKRYHDPNPRKKAFGAKVVITLKNGKKVAEEQGVADAHPYGARPFKRKNYINKFLTLTENILNKKESDRFLKVVQNLKKLKAGQLDKLNLEVKKNKIKRNFKKGIF